MTGTDIQEGAAERLDRMMRSHGTSVLRICSVYLKDTALAEDAAQDTFIKAYRSMTQKPPPGEEAEVAWLMRIAINTCKDMRRSVWFRRVTGLDTREARKQTVSTDDKGTGTLFKSLEALPDKYRDIILLHYYQGMRIDEISSVLRISRASGYNRLNKAREYLRVELEKEGWL